jgi:hypothetical protein
VENRAGDRDPLHHATAVGPHRLVAAALHLHTAQHLLDAREWQAVQTGVVDEVLPRRQLSVEQRLVGEQPEPPPDPVRRPRQRLAEELDLAAVRA